MTTFNGTPGVDAFIGADNVADLFRFSPADLTSADTVAGGGGSVVDQLQLTAAGVIAAGAFANVGGIETILLRTGTNSLTIPDALAASADGATLTVLGGDGNDTIDASLLTAANRVFVYTGAGTAAISGGAGDDWYLINNAADTIVEAAGRGAFDRVFAHVSYTLGTGVVIETVSTDDDVGTTAINLTGNELPNAIWGNAGDNILDGGAGADFLAGLAGNDWYFVDNADDFIREARGEGTLDRVFAHVSFALTYAEIEILSTDDHAGTAAIDLSGGELANAIYGNAGNNTLNGGGGDDSLDGFGGIDTLNGGPGDDKLYASAGASTLNGDEGNDVLYGIAASPAMMSGGADDDWYFVANAGDVVDEASGEGANDWILAHVSYTLGAGAEIEKLSTDDHAGTTAINLTGNELANAIYGNAGDNILDGGAGDDRLYDFGGTDTLRGGPGNDWLYVDDASDVVVEAAGEGTADRVVSSASYALAAGTEVEILATGNEAGPDAIDLAGNDFAQTIFGNAGNNTLEGGGGNDTLAGLGGDDWYYVDNTMDVVFESPGAGTLDRVFAQVSFSLAPLAEIEILSTDDDAGTVPINLTGSAFDNVILGNAGANILAAVAGDDSLFGNAGNDTLKSGSGNDVLDGGSGSDTADYSASSGPIVADLRVAGPQNTGFGSDTLISIENITSGAGADFLTGDDSDNLLSGGGANDRLNGGAGNDTLDGGAGADAADYSTAPGAVIVDLAVATPQATGHGTYTLISIENVIGSSGNDVLRDNVADNVFDGQGGNDLYYVAGAGDVVNERPGEGNDHVFAHVSYTLKAGQEVETLSTDDDTGTAAINLIGNELDNTIYGNAGNNVLYSGGGENIVDSGGGNDQLVSEGIHDALIGGSGNDSLFVRSIYLYPWGGAQVTVDGGSGNDTIALPSRVFPSGESIHSNVDLGLTGAQDIGYGGLLTVINVENASGGYGTLIGNTGPNGLQGAFSPETLNGRGGNDSLVGYGGDDSFVFDTALDASTNVDTIVDFDYTYNYITDDDTIQLALTIFTTLGVGELPAGAFFSGAGAVAAADASDRIVYDTTTGALYYDADGAAGVDAVQFAVLTFVAPLTNADFLVI